MKPYQSRPKKSLGQHFLHSQGHLAGIVEGLLPVPGEKVLEIGAGRGALTAKLLEAGLAVTALEIDRDLSAGLREEFGREKRFSLIEADARTFDYSFAGPSFKVAGNLPYQSATHITARLLEHAERIPLMVLTYQREVARRLTAEPGSRIYGYLTCLARYRCRTEYLATIPPGAFWPPPKVHSGVVRFTRRPGHPPLTPQQEESLMALIRGAFSRRRKTLVNALTGQVTDLPKAVLKETLADWGVDAGRRPETFSLDEFVLIWKILRRDRAAGGGPEAP